MSSLRGLFRVNRAVTGYYPGSVSENASLIRYTICPIRRNFWSTFSRRKEEAAKERREPEPLQEEPPKEASTETPKQLPSANDLFKELQEVKDSRDETYDKYKRALAENENVRQRLTKQIEDAKIFGIQKFAKDLLEVSDVIDKAIECVPKEEVKDSNPHLKNLYQGLKMTGDVLQSVFHRNELTKFNPLNEKFNPQYHEAIKTQATEGKESGSIIAVIESGYKLRDRIIRAPKVIVAE